MRIFQLTPGTGHFYCGSCLRDGALVRALRARGNDALAVPLYLPFVLEEEGGSGNGSEPSVHMGGINMYLQQKLPLLGHMPRFLADQLDRPGLLRWASARGGMTDSADLGPMTVSMLHGESGRQARELDKLVEWMAEQPPPDVISLSNVMLAGMVRRLKQAFDVPVVSSLQGEASFLDGLPSPHRDEAWNALRERAADVDAFVAVSAWYGDQMRARLGIAPERMHVVHNGIDARELAATPWSPPAVPTIGFLARLCREKGLPTLVEAFLRLKRDGAFPGLRLRACGAMLAADEPLVAELSRRVAHAGHGDDFDVLPNVDRPDKLRFLRSLSVFSVPATYGESFGLYLLEALAAGVPLVQPRHGAFPELLEATGGGLSCEPDDPADLASVLARLLADGPAARELSERGRRAVLERFTEERMALGVETVCAAARDGRRRAVAGQTQPAAPGV